jgi:predicted acetyltransferase
VYENVITIYISTLFDILYSILFSFLNWMLRLDFPNISHKIAYLDILTEWKQSGEFEAWHVSPGALFRGESFEEFLESAVRDLTAKEPKVPATLYFLMDGERIFGGVQIRHHIEHPNLREYGWHIGYGIRPSERRKWYATEMLHLALIEAQKLGLNRVMLGCYDDNIGSQRVIEKNGGIFERYTEHEGKKSRRYWVEL